MEKCIVTFGELLLRLAPPGYTRFVQTDIFNAVYGGGEANVAVSCANYGIDARFVTKLPNHDIGQAAMNALRRYGVDTSYIARGGDRIGIYFCERGASQRPSKVIYDRANSSIATAAEEDFNWDRIFEGAHWFHFTGITPAVSTSAAKITETACRIAKAHGLTISCDLNYRKKLWTCNEANKVMSQLCKYVDVCIANEEDAKDVFGIQAQNTDIFQGKLSREGYEDVARQLTERFGFQKVGITLRESISASQNNWSAMLYSDGKAFFSKKYGITIVDRVGGGDSFSGALIYGLSEGMENRQAIEFAAAASCLKHTIEGDANQVSVSEVLQLAGGDGSGRVQR